MTYKAPVDTEITITRPDSIDDEFFDTYEEAETRLDEIKENKEEWSQFFTKEWVEDVDGNPEEDNVTVHENYDD